MYLRIFHVFSANWTSINTQLGCNCRPFSFTLLMLGSSHYINFHVCTWNKEITYLVTSVVTDITFFHLSRQSRPSSGSSYKRSLIWGNSVCKSVKRRLCEVTEVKCLRCHNKGGDSFLYFYSCQSYQLQFGAQILPYLKMCRFSRIKFIEKCLNFISSDLIVHLSFFRLFPKPFYDT